MNVYNELLSSIENFRLQTFERVPPSILKVSFNMYRDMLSENDRGMLKYNPRNDSYSFEGCDIVIDGNLDEDYRFE